MSVRSASSSIERTRPIRLTCRYQLFSSSTVNAARGSRRMKRSRSRLSSMFTSTRPSSQSYHVGTVCGEPSGRSVATTAGLGRERNSSISGGTGTCGIGGAYPRFSQKRFSPAYDCQNCIARIEGPVAMDVADVVACVAGRLEAFEAENLLSDDLDVPFRNGSEFAPERVERVPVEPSRAGFEAGWIDEVRCADLGNVNGQARVLTHEHARGASVVEMDV